jgi:putative hydrolase of the HAD superfamily
VRAICFDLDGTLLEFTRDYGDLLADAFRDAAGEVRGEWIETYEEAFYAAFRNHEPDPVRRGFAAVGGPDPDACRAALLRVETGACEPPAGAAEDLDRLGDRYRLGVVTNGVPDWQRHKLRENGLLDRFDAVVASYEAGAHKPDAAPFELAAERLPADAYAMVGDDDADVEGARAAGWAPHRYGGGGFDDLPGAIDWGE